MESSGITIEGRKYSLSMSKLLGSGTFGKVYHEKELGGSERPVAIKKISQSFLEISGIKDSLSRERDIMKKLKGEGVIRYLGSYETLQDIYIVTEYCNGGSLESLLKEKKTLPEETALNYVREIALTFEKLKEIHGEQFIHRDIKPANILLHDGKIKLCDFGLARFISLSGYSTLAKLTRGLGSPIYKSLEALKGELYDSKTDVWSTGILLYQMLFGKFPWENRNEFRLVQEIESYMNKDMKIPDRDIKPETRDLIIKMLKVDQKERITWEEVLNHPAFQKNKIIKEYCYDPLSRPLGSGAYGTVYLGRKMKNEEEVVAIKVVNLEHISRDEVKREIDVHSKIKCEYIVEYLDSEIGEKEAYIISAYCNEGSLRNKMENGNKLSEYDALNYILQLALAFQQLEDHFGNEVIHRDIKPDNVLLHNGSIKLADFGLAKPSSARESKMTGGVGTFFYMSPQMLEGGEDYTSKTDIWSAGVMLFEMLFGTRPWDRPGEDIPAVYKLYQQIKKKGLEFPPEVVVSDETKDLISSMLELEEQKRIDWRSLPAHPAFYLVNKINVEET